MKTYMAKKGEIAARWYLVDVADKVLGRVSTQIAQILMGKHRPEYTPHVDTGDFVVVVNADKIKITGAKLTQRSYERFSGYPSGRKETSMGEMLKKHPDRVIRQSVRRMLPKTKLGRAMIKKLKVYAGDDHPHQAQMPEKIEL